MSESEESGNLGDQVLQMRELLGKDGHELVLDIVEGLLKLCSVRENEIIELSEKLEQMKREAPALDTTLDMYERQQGEVVTRNPVTSDITSDGNNKIMIVDPVKLMRDNLSDLFLHNGLVVVAKLDSASDTLDLLLRLAPDFLTLDIDMPDMDGFALLDSIRRMDENLKIILISRQLEKEEVIKVVKNGVLDIINKPVNPERLMQIISNHLAPAESEAAT